MSNFRLIPSLLLKKNGLYKGIEFANYKYVGDPINAVRIFNAKEVDELFFFDIEATKNNSSVSLDIISKLANECYVPFAVGGGINSIEHIQNLINLGVEKVCINSHAIKNPDFVSQASEIFGSQAIVVCIDFKKDENGYSLYSHSGTRKVEKDVFDYAIEMEKVGAGEILFNCVNRDGKMQGFDLAFYTKVSKLLQIPVSAGCGAGRVQHFKALTSQTQVSAASAGSFFVFHGPHRAVLISYPKDFKILATK